MTGGVTRTIGDKDVTIYELTVREIRSLANATVAEGSNDYLANMLVEDAPFSVIEGFSDVTVDQLEDWTPREITQLRDHIKKVNPDFFAMSRRLEGLMATIGTREKSSTEPSSE
jgi:hypothetical protein